MRPGTKESVERGIALFERLVHEDPRLARELAESRAKFFDGPPPEAPQAARFAERRHLEWFLHDRFSESLQGLPVVALRERWLAEADPEQRALVDAFPSSVASLFEITGVREGAGVWLRDLLGRGEYPLVEPEAAAGLEAGDLVVGRVFPVGDSVFRVSPAAACFRNASLLEALRADVERLRGARRGSARVLQSELERMFFAHGEAPAPVRPLADALQSARNVLEEGGLSAAESEDVLTALRASPPVPGALPGLDDPIAVVLDRLAMESEVDLERARCVLAEAWIALVRDERSGQTEPTRADDPALEPASGQPVAARSALERFDRGRAEGVELERLFAQLERDLGLEEPDEDDSGPAPDFPDVVGAVIEEFLWDTERESGPDARRRFEVVRGLGRHAARIESLGVFENLSARDLQLYLTAAAIENGEVPDADAARTLCEATLAFARWSDRHHELGIAGELEAGADELASNLARIAEVNRHLPQTEAQATAARARVGEIRTVAGAPRLSLEGSEPVELDVSDEAARRLRSGDLVRVAHGQGERYRALLAFPPEARGFLRRK